MTDEQLHKALNDVRPIGQDRPILRDQFAMAALTGIMADGWVDSRACKRAYEIADAMLEARKEKK